MLNLLKTSAVAAVVAAAPFAASASTFMADGATTTITAAGIYNFDGLVIVGAAPWEHTFDLSGAVGAGEATAAVTVGPQVSQFTDLTLEWLAADGMTVLETSDVSSPNEVVLGTSFADPNAIQTLVVDWASTTANPGQGFDIRVDLQVAAVPVPAAGLMLLTALGGAAALRRRNK